MPKRPAPSASVAGFAVLPAPLPGAAPFARAVYAKRHRAKSGEAAQAPTLFLTNAAPDADKAALAALCGGAGAVRSVALKGGRAVHAHVEMASPAALEAALALALARNSAARDVDVDRRGPEAPRGLEAMLAAHDALAAAAADPEAVQEEVDEVVERFEAREAAAEAERERRRNEPDEDGFVTVTYRSRARPLEDDALGGVAGGAGAGGDASGRRKPGRSRKRKKKAPTMLKNFYSFQAKEEKRERLKELRKRFEEDKARVEKLKASRRFRASLA